MKIKYEYDIFDNKSRYLHYLWVVFVTTFLLIACVFKLTLFWSLSNYVQHGWVQNTPIIKSRVGLPVTQHEEDNLYKIVCYYTINSDKSDKSHLYPKSIDPYLCTHIIVGFAGILNNSIQPNMDDYKVYKAVISLKNINPSLKVLISIGEQNSTSSGFSTVVGLAEHRSQFVNNSLEWVKKQGFDGIDLDWEFPSWPENNPDQRKNFTLLLAEFRDKIKKSKSKILLSVAVAAAQNIMLQSYDILNMSNIVDFVNLMAYDYHMYTKLFPVTGPNAPLYKHRTDSGLLSTLNTNWSANYWNIWGMPKDKIVVGIPTYGHSFILVNEDNAGWNAPAKGFGSVGDKGFVTQPQACSFIAIDSTTHVFDDDYKVPYAYNGLEWVSYENIESVLLKAYYIKDNQYGGAMIYSLNTDDFSGNCSGNNFDLTRKVSNILSPEDI